jgi:hypothetical protein
LYGVCCAILKLLSLLDILIGHPGMSIENFCEELCAEFIVETSPHLWGMKGQESVVGSCVHQIFIAVTKCLRKTI